MEWVNGYKNTTLAFWLDEDDVSFDQIMAFFALIAGSIYVIFLGEYGGGTPLVKPKQYLFTMIGCYIFLYYITGGALWIYSNTFAKYIRLVLLHIVLSLLFISVQASLHFGFGVTADCAIASLIAASLLYAHTRRVHNTHNKKRVLVTAITVITISFLLNLFFILPWQGAE